LGNQIKDSDQRFRSDKNSDQKYNILRDRFFKTRIFFYVF